MKHWLRKLALWLGIVPTTTYAYPALDIHLSPLPTQQPIAMPELR